MIAVSKHKRKSFMGSAILTEMAIAFLAMGLIYLGGKLIERPISRLLGLNGVENKAVGFTIVTILLLIGLLLLPHSVQGFSVGLIVKNLLIGASLLGCLTSLIEMYRFKKAD